jgi:hypothetical protein
VFDCAPDEYCLHEVILHVASYHTDREPQYNENNPGLGLRIKSPERKIFFAAGAYRNSVRSASVYAGAGMGMLDTGLLTFRFMVGGITGYSRPVLPFVFPELVLSYKEIGLMVGYVPKVNNEIPQFFTFSLVKRF